MRQYDVSLSFAGEDRPVAKRLAALLIARGLNVFYDEYEQANLWGKDLYAHLSKVYKDDAKFCLMLISEHYARKQWTNHERKSAQARAFSESSEYILPLRLDDAKVEGILDTLAFFDVRKHSDDAIVSAVDSKVHAYNALHEIPHVLVRAEDILPRQALSDSKGRPIRDADMKTMCPSCGVAQLLSEAALSQVEGETIYTCKNGCQPIVVIGRPGTVAWPGRGFRLGEHVIRNVREIEIQSEDMPQAVSLPAREAALMSRRPSPHNERMVALRVKLHELLELKTKVHLRIEEAASDFDDVTMKTLHAHMRGIESARAKIEAELASLEAGDSLNLASLHTKPVQPS